MRIGFTGHRPNRMPLAVGRIRSRLDEALVWLVTEARKRNPAEDVAAISPLAEGSDRLFAEAALDHGLALEALLPMPVDDYVGTFENQATLPQFHALLVRARSVCVLPGARGDSKAAYEALGHALADESDVLVAVWDGKPAAGRGGTPEVIEQALQRGRRVVWVDAAVDRPAVLLAALRPTIEFMALSK